MKADLHVHSSASFDVPNLVSLSPLALFHKATANPDPDRRMDYFALTDHDTMAGYEELMRRLPESQRARVIPAVEHTIKDPEIGFTIHVNLFGLSPRQYAEIRDAGFGLDALLAYCDKTGILAQYNHPAWWERRELRAKKVNFAKVRQVAEKFRIIEVSAARTHLQNRIAVGLAHEMGHTITSSTDTHTGDIGRAHTIAAGDTVQEFLASISRGEVLTHIESMTRRSLIRESRDLIDEFLYNGERSGEARRHDKKVLAKLEAVGNRLVGSRFVQGCELVRGSLRFMLRRVTLPIIRVAMRHESRLENELATTDLQAYMQPVRARRVA